MALNYIAAFHLEGTLWSVLFPGLPGCQTMGESLDEAQAMAAEALEGHLLCLAEDGEPWPEPLTLDQVRAHPDGTRDDGGPADLYLGLAAPPRPGRAKRISITVPENWLHLIDAAAAEAGLNRSAFLTQAALAEARRGKT